MGLGLRLPTFAASRQCYLGQRPYSLVGPSSSAIGAVFLAIWKWRWGSTQRLVHTVGAVLRKCLWLLLYEALLVFT